MKGHIKTSQKLQAERASLTKASKLHFVHWCVIALSLCITVAAWYFSSLQINEKIANEFDRQANQVLELISERMSKYEDGLWGGVSAIQAQGGDISYKDWATFSESLRIDEKYPGINGIGVIHYVPPQRLDHYLKEQRKDRADYSLHPEHDENEYWPITYIEPFSANAKAVGLDMAHETNRFTAAKKARDTGQAQITGPIVLVQDSGKTAGFLFYAPFYKGGVYDSLVQRQKHFTGLVYAPFVVNKLMAGTLEKEKRQLGIKITDGDQIIYDENVAQEEDYDDNPLFKKRAYIDFYGRTWVFDIWSAQSFRASASSSQPLMILLGGIFIDSLLFFLFVSLTRANRRAVSFADSMNRELQVNQHDLEASNAELVKAKVTAELASQSKSEFLAKMSHEIRTPMNAVLGYTELLKDSNLNQEQQKNVDIIHLSGTSLLQIINDILDFSKIEAGKMELESVVFDPRKLANEVCDMNRAHCPSGVALRCIIDEDMPGHVVGDPGRLCQILINLLGNSIKFTCDGSIELVVEFMQELNGHAVIQYSVVDTGVGIAPEKQDQIFEEFQQADNSTTREYGGTGLGLAISRRLVGMMNSQLYLESELGKGSTFYFTLMLPIAKEQQLRSDYNIEPGQPATVSDTGKKHRILLAEDNITNQKLIVKVLECLDCQIDIAINGQEAVETVAEKDGGYDLIFMDMQMPEMNGLQASQSIRELGYEHLPIIALTANAFDDDRDLCLESGMNDFLSKPVSRQDLLGMINKWIVQLDNVSV